MALDEQRFRILHPEFKGASPTLVNEKLAMAATRLSAPLLGDMYDEAHGWKTAHLLATTPWGMAARIDTKKAPDARPGETIYSWELNQILILAGCGLGTT